MGSAVAGASAASTAALLFAYSGVSPITATVFRTLYALPVIGWLWWWQQRRQQSRNRKGRAGPIGSQPKKLRKWGIIAGVGLAADLVSWQAAIEYIGTGLATLLIHTQVLIVTLLAWLLWGEKPGKTTGWALPIVLVGVLLLSGLGRADSFGENPWLGVLLGLVGAGCYSLFLMAFRYANSGTGSLYPALFQATLGALGTAAILALLIPGLEMDWQPSWPEHGWLLLIAIGTQTGAYLLIGFSLPRLAARQTSFLILMQPVLALVWGAWLLSEQVSWLQGLGVVGVLAGIGLVIVETGRSKPIDLPNKVRRTS